MTPPSPAPARGCHHRPAWSLIGLLLLALALAAPAQAKAPGLKELRFSGDKVTLDVKDAPAGSLLEELAKRGGFKVKFRGEVDKIKLSDSLRDLSMQDTLRRLLLGHNYLMNTDSSGAVVSVYLIAPESEAAAAGKARRLPSRPPARAAIPASGRVTHVGASQTPSGSDNPPGASAKPPEAAPPRAMDTRNGRSPIRGPIRRPRP